MSNDNKEKTRYYAKLFGFRRAVPIILAALSVFITVCFFTEGAGLLGGAVSSLLKGLFSIGAYLIPALLLLHAIFYAGDYVKGLTVSRTVFSVVAVFLVSGIEYIAYYWSEPVFEPASCYVNQTAGGFLGSTVGFALTKALGPVGLIILSVTVIAVYVTYFFATGNSVASKSVMRLFTSVKDFFVGFSKKAKSKKEKKLAQKAELERIETEKHTGELLADNFFGIDASTSELKIEKLGINEKTEVAPQPVEEAAPAPTEPEKKNSERPKRTLNLDYGLGIESKVSSPDSKAADTELGSETARSTETPRPSRAALGLDDSADNVFTKDFDPFDFATAEKIIARPATRAKVNTVGISEVATPLSGITEKDVERMRAKEADDRRRAEFDERKRRILENISSANGSSAAAQPNNSYSAPAAAQPNNSYSAPAAQQSNSYSAPAAQQSNSYSAPAADNAEKHKTIEFNVEKESSAPSEGDSVTFIFDKSEHYPDETQKIAAEVAKMLEKNVTGYTPSANKSFTYMKVTESASSAQSAQDAAILNAPITPNTPVFDGGYGSQTAFAEPRTESVADRAADTQVSADESGKQTESHRESIAFGEFSTDAGTVSPATNAEQSNRSFKSEESFAEYRAPEIPESEEQPSAPELKIERTMIEPSVDTEKDIFTERDKQFTVISADTEGEYDLDATPSEDVVDIFADSSAAESEIILNSAASQEAQAADIAEIFGDEDDGEFSEDELTPEEEGDEPEEIPPEEQNPDILKQREMFSFFKNESVNTSPSANAPDSELETEEDEPPFDIPSPAKDETPAPAPSTALITEKEAKKTAKAPSYKNFKFPPLDMLGLNDDFTDSNVDAEIQENADRLIDTLSSFNVTASIKGVDRGPRITRYEVVPAKGVKVSSIMNLQDDIALSLAADGIRMEAPIPGKSAVGVEIPNKHSTTVRLRELLETDEFKSEKSKTAICIGKDVAGQPVINDIAKMPHLLIAGATGMGKSVCINSLLISILYKARPDEVKLIMIDPKQVEFTMYNGIPHLLIPVVSDAKQAAGALMWAVDEMEKRFTQLNSACVRNIDGYNEKVAQDPSIGEPMSKIIIVIDEFADLMLQVKDPVESLVMRIAQKARAAGIHLIIGTQRPSTNVITGTIKANIPSRMSCKVASNVDSRTVLDSVGAEKLLNRGDMLFAYAGAIKPLRVQGAFVSDGEVQNIMNHLKQFSNGDNYDEAVMEEIKRQAAKCNKKGSDGDDDRDGDESNGEGFLNDRQFLEAVEVAVNSGKISTSLLQRKISIGYGKAAKFIDVMCDMGIVGESNGSKPREVLITADEWREKLSRLTYD